MDCENYVEGHCLYIPENLKPTMAIDKKCDLPYRADSNLCPQKKGIETLRQRDSELEKEITK